MRAQSLFGPYISYYNVGFQTILIVARLILSFSIFFEYNITVLAKCIKCAVFACEVGAGRVGRVGRDGFYLFILIRSDSNELRLREDVSPEGAVGKLHYVVGSYNMKPGLVFMH